MDIEFCNLTIQKLVLHEIFKGGTGVNYKPPKYNSKLATLTLEERHVLEQRVLQSLSKTSSSIETDIRNPLHNNAFLNVIDYLKFAHPQKAVSDLDKDSKFLDISKLLTNHLSLSYTRPNVPGGIVIIFTGRIGIRSNRYLAIIKAEKQDGFTMEENNSEMVMRLINDLFLTQNQKLYKIAIYIEQEERKYDNLLQDINNNFNTYLYDKNVSAYSTNQLADYFYHTFLDWEIKHTNKQFTNQFYEESNSFINKANLSDEEKVNFTTALYSYLMLNRSATINAYEFATTYLPDEFADEYINHMTTQGIPTRDIVKDISGLQKKLKKRNVYFSSNVKISAPFKDFDEIIKISNDEAGITTINIKGSIIKQ